LTPFKHEIKNYAENLRSTESFRLRLLAVASPEFPPCIAIGGFAGLCSAEIQRLEWSEVDLAGGHIVIGASKSKTASRRLVPISENLAAWLASYSEQRALVYKGDYSQFYTAQKITAQAAGLTWKANALRHSYASYRQACRNTERSAGRA
jgi:integrase